MIFKLKDGPMAMECLILMTLAIGTAIMLFGASMLLDNAEMREYTGETRELIADGACQAMKDVKTGNTP